MIDLDPKTSKCSQFSSNIAASGPSIFHIPTEKAKETNLVIEREKRAYTEALADQKDYESINCQCHADTIMFIIECTINIINGFVHCEVEALIPFQQLRTLCNKATPD